MIAAALAGVATWTLLEYLIHRWMGHNRRFRRSPFGVEHIRHHIEGNYFAPAPKKLLAAAIAVAVLSGPAIAIGGVAHGLAYVAGLVAFYGAYEVLHRREHTHAGIGPYGRWARRHHFHHHFADGRANHGVTSPLWDLVFGTYQRPTVIRVPQRLCMTWLLDRDGAIRPEHAGTYELPVMARTKPELSQETIRAAALHLIDQDGLDDFSTRKLGRALGCEAMAIYYYYPSKDALLDAIVDTLMSNVVLAVTGDDWIEVLRDVAHAYRRIGRDHPRAFPLLATRRFASEGTYAFMEQLFEHARRHGVAERIAARFYRVVSSYCNGFILNELAAPPVRTTAQRKRFAHVTAVSAWLEPQYLDEIFEFGLELHLEALAKAIPA